MILGLFYVYTECLTAFCIDVMMYIVFFSTEFLSLQVPHGLALMEHWDRVCVADRENMRVVCPRAGLYSKINEPSTALTIQEPDLGRVFAVAAKGIIY